VNKSHLFLALPVCSSIWFATSIIIAGHFYPNYSHVSQFISELGATGSPDGTLVNYLGFIPTELLILSFVTIGFSVLPKTKKNAAGLILIAIYAFTLGIAAMFPCDFGCGPEVSSVSHRIHILSAILGYSCAIAAIFLISSGSNDWSKSKYFSTAGYILGILAIAAFINLNPEFNMVGAIQRVLEISIYTWLILLGLLVYRFRPA